MRRGLMAVVVSAILLAVPAAATAAVPVAHGAATCKRGFHRHVTHRRGRRHVSCVRDKPKAPADPDAAMIEKNKNNPVIKSITETAKPSETPKSPTRNGFNFDDDALK